MDQKIKQKKRQGLYLQALSWDDKSLNVELLVGIPVISRKNEKNNIF